MTEDGKRRKQKRHGRCLSVLIFACVCIASPVLVLAEPMTLAQALQIAFEQSPTIRQAQYSLEVSERNLQANQASLKSQFSLTLQPYQYSKDRVFSDLFSIYNTQEQTSSAAQLSITQPIKWTDGTLSISEYVDWRRTSSAFAGEGEETNYSSSFRVNFNQPLFTYNRTLQTQRELQLALENAQLNYAIQKLQIEASVTEQFLSLYHSQRSVQIAREELTNATESHEIIQSKVDAGISAKEELYQAELTLANSRAALENRRMSLENAMDNFKILLGLPLDTELEVIADIRKVLVDVDRNLALEHGLSNRMELRQQDIAIQNAIDNLIRTGAQNEFKASVDLSYGLTGTDDDFSEVYQSPTKSHSVGITVNIPLFDWGKKKHSIAARQTEIESQRLSAGEEKKQIQREIRQAYRYLRNQELQIEIAEQNVRNARLTYELNLERYRNGDLSSKDMSYYQNQLSSEQLGEVQALINYKLALLDLKIKALWDFEKNEPVVGQS